MWQHNRCGMVFISYKDKNENMAFVEVGDISFVERPEDITLIHLKDGTVLSSADSVETIFRRIGE